MNKCEHCEDHGRVQVIFAGERMGGKQGTRIVRRTAKLEDYRYRYLSTIPCTCSEEEVLVGALQHAAIIKSCAYPMLSTLPTQKLSEATGTLNPAI